MYDEFVFFLRELYKTDQVIPLHSPIFRGNEKKYLSECVESTYVSSVGNFVPRFEESVANFTGAKFAIATVNGTSALHTALLLNGVETGSEVITQSLTFVATCNAITYCNASPVFVDIDPKTFGMSFESLKDFLEGCTEIRNDGFCWNKYTNKKITCCMPMHTFGFPVDIKNICDICSNYHIPVVEDAAEGLGSYYDNKHVGLYGKTSAISFNGNKVVTSGGGGVLITNSNKIACKAKHITTTSKVNDGFNFIHDRVGFNYRMPNINASLGLAQMESLSSILESKKNLHALYQEWGRNHGVKFIGQPERTTCNFWLNSIVLEGEVERNKWLEKTNAQGVSTRPVWRPMHFLDMYCDCFKVDLSNTEYYANRLLNVPSGVYPI